MSQNECNFYQYRVECAWCGDQIAIRETSDPRMHGRVSHGCCEQCLAVCNERAKEYAKEHKGKCNAKKEQTEE